MAYILAVDDTKDILEALTMIMTMRGHTVKAVSTKAEVTHELASQRPDVILLDVFLGYSDGRDICREIREKYGPNHTKIILISASGRLLENFEDCGADAILEKPFDLTHLINVVESVLN